MFQVMPVFQVDPPPTMPATDPWPTPDPEPGPGPDVIPPVTPDPDPGPDPDVIPRNPEPAPI